MNIFVFHNNFNQILIGDFQGKVEKDGNTYFKIKELFSGVEKAVGPNQITMMLTPYSPYTEKEEFEIVSSYFATHYEADDKMIKMYEKAKNQVKELRSNIKRPNSKILHPINS